MPTPKPDNLSFSPGTHTVEEVMNQLAQVVALTPHSCNNREIETNVKTIERLGKGREKKKKGKKKKRKAGKMTQCNVLPTQA